MSNPDGTIEACLGRVLAVEGSEVCIGLASPLPKGPDRPTVGKFVAISGHDTTLVGMISDVSLRAEEPLTAPAPSPASTSSARSSAPPPAPPASAAACANTPRSATRPG